MRAAPCHAGETYADLKGAGTTMSQVLCTVNYDRVTDTKIYQVPGISLTYSDEGYSQTGHQDEQTNERCYRDPLWVPLWILRVLFSAAPGRSFSQILFIVPDYFCMLPFNFGLSSSWNVTRTDQ